MQKPSLGRIVLYVAAAPAFSQDHVSVPWPAMITEVHSDAVVNIAGFEDKGRPFAVHNVPLLESADRPAVPAPFCYWPPREDVAKDKKHS